MRRGIKIPRKRTRLRFLRSFFLTFEVSRGELLALLFLCTLEKAVPLNGDSLFFALSCVDGTPAADAAAVATNSKTIMGGRYES